MLVSDELDQMVRYRDAANFVKKFQQTVNHHWDLKTEEETQKEESPEGINSDHMELSSHMSPMEDLT